MTCKCPNLPQKTQIFGFGPIVLAISITSLLNVSFSTGEVVIENNEFFNICQYVIVFWDYLDVNLKVVGNKFTVARFVRWEMGEGLEKRNDDFAAEVAAQSKV